MRVLLLTALLLSPLVAEAADPPPPAGVSSSKGPALGGMAQEQRSRYLFCSRYWGTLPSGAFVSGRFDVGLYFFRPRVSFGYGKPHWQWVGIDLNPLISSEGVGLYGGLRFALPYVDLRVGARYRYAFRRSFLDPDVGEYTREDIERLSGPRSRYVSVEAELTGSLPLGPGNIFSETALTAVLGVDEGYYVYEETIRTVLDPPWVWRAMLGYMLRLLPQGALRIGPVVQLVGSPGRGTITTRAGLMVRFRLAYNLSLRGTFVPTFAGPDELGAASSDTYQVGLRYIWATSPRAR